MERRVTPPPTTGPTRPSRSGLTFASVTATGAEVLAAAGALVLQRFHRQLATNAAFSRQRYLIERAEDDGQPAALALADVRPDGLGRVHSLATAPAYRQRGIATALLGRLEARLAEAGGSAAQALYRTDLRSLGAVETVLAKRGWTPPRAAQHLFRGHAATVLDAPAFQGVALPEGCTLFDWSALAPEEAAALRAEVGQSVLPELSPFQLGERLDPACSVGARCGGSVAGWMVVHRVGAQGTGALRQYTSLWVRPRFVGTGLGRALLRAAIERHVAADADGVGLFAVDARNRTMVNLARRRLALAPAATLRLAGKRLRA